MWWAAARAAVGVNATPPSSAGSVSRAAERLGLTQPAVSKSLAEIERLFGQYQCALRLAIRPTRSLLGLEPFLCGAGNQLPAPLQQDGLAIAALHQRSARLALEFASAIELLA